MKIIFNDAAELQVQSVTESNGQLIVKAVAVTLDALRTKFSDALATKKMEVREMGQTIATYTDYTTLYRLEEYTGKIYGVVMYKAEKTPEVQREVQAAAVIVAQIQAQSLTDAQALAVQAIYPEWNENSIGYTVDYKVLHGGVLYKCIQDHTSQLDWAPGVAPSLWAAIAGDANAGTLDDPIPVPDSVTTSGFEYECGKYYSENDMVYLMDYMGMDAGDKVILYFPPSQLVGTYFKAVE